MLKSATNLMTKAAVVLALTLAFVPCGVANAEIVKHTVKFSAGSSSTTINNVIKGDTTKDYVLSASAGQVLKVTLSGSSIVYFNVLPPGSNGEAIFNSSMEGNSFAGTLGVSGKYTIRVYQMRATARRNETGNFKLKIAVKGEPSGGSSSAGNRSSASTGAVGSLKGIEGMDSVAAFDVMTSRGFKNVDSFFSGETQYGIFYSPATGVCAQLTMADSLVLDAMDIQTHPNCH